MSYRNPTQHIDRQSGQIEQNLQKTLAGIGTGVVSSINKIHADNAAKTAAIRAEADKRVADAQNSIMQTQSKNPTADFGDLDEQLNLMNRLLMKDPAKRTAEEKTFINSMENIGDNMANMLKNTAMSQEAMMEQVNKIPGTPGAVDPKENPELYAKMAVLSNQVEGSTKARYKTNKNGQIVFSLDVYQKTKDGEKFVGSVINDNVATTQMPPVIPDVTKEMTEAINITMNTNDFVSRFGEYREADGALVGKDGKGTGYKVTEDYFRNQLKPNADMILAGLSPREKIRLYNNTLDKGKNPDLSYDDDLTGKGKEDLIKDALLNSLMRQTKKSKNIFAKVSEDKKDTKKGSTYEPSELEKMAAKVDKQFKELQKWDGKGNPTPSTIPSSIVKGVQAKWDTGLKSWVIQQKSGNKWEDVSSLKDPTDYEKLALELGYDFQKKKVIATKPLEKGQKGIGFAGTLPESEAEGEIKLSKPELP
jgi:hypothetical protein